VNVCVCECFYDVAAIYVKRRILCACARERDRVCV